jgi:hypothetical protein
MQVVVEVQLAVKEPLVLVPRLIVVAFAADPHISGPATSATAVRSFLFISALLSTILAWYSSGKRRANRGYPFVMNELENSHDDGGAPLVKKTDTRGRPASRC